MKKLLLITSVLFFAACSKSSSDNNSGSQYTGTWTGTYSGQRTNGDKDSGTWKAVIELKGTTTITATSVVYTGTTLTFAGIVDASGNINATASNLATGNYFKGSFSASSVSGTWYEPIAGDPQVWNGTWKGAKQ